MSEGVVINPDTRFIREVMASGGKDLKKCMQCGTCSVVCELAPQEAAFPRKQIFLAQWGLKEKLVRDPAIWLCHNCGDCTAYCPRGARPGDVFGALRQAAVEYFAWPSFIGKMTSRPAAFLALLIVPLLLLWAVAAPVSTHRSEAKFGDVFPIPSLEILFFAVSGFVLLVFVVGLARFLKGLKSAGAGGIVWAGLIAAIVEIFTHARFSKCSENKSRRLGHLLTFWGFAGLALVGTVVGVAEMLHLMESPLRFDDPVGLTIKVFANLAALALLAGSVLLLVNRIQDPVTRAASTYFDWFFLLTLVLVALTGILSELLRLTQVVGVMYEVYSVHLVLILLLFLYAPYSKFAHFVYRTAAMAAVRGADAEGKG